MTINVILSTFTHHFLAIYVPKSGFNAVYAYGISAFAKKCSSSGVDGVIIPDLPLEERLEINEIFKENNVALISLVSPTSKNRLKDVVENSDGFIYCISSNGVTGGNSKFDKNLESLVKEIRNYTTLPIALGFGVTSEDDIKNYKDVFDGFIVGSEIIRKIGESEDSNSYNVLDDYLHKMSFEAHK
jgi:tryptophan synthase alpha chain